MGEIKSHNHKKKKDHLAEFISALSKTEKSHFKKYVSAFSGKQKNNYLKLFDDLLNTKKNKATPQLRQYLYELILQSLEKYYSKTIPSIRIKNQLNAVRVLFQKGMYGRAKKIVSRNIEWYKEESDHLSWLEAVHWKRKIATIEINFEEISKTIEEERKINAILNDMVQHEAIYAKTYKLALSTAYNKKDDSRAALENIISDPLMQNAGDCLSIQSKSYFYRVKSICYTLLNDKVNGFNNAVSRIELLDANPGFVSTDPQNYINALTNGIELCFMTGNPAKGLSFNHKLKNFEVKSRQLISRRQTRSLLHDLQLYLMEPVHGTITELESRLDIHQKEFAGLVRIDERTEMDFLMIGIVVNDGQFKKALALINKFLQNAPHHIRTDIQTHVRVLNLYVHLRLGNYDLLPYLTRNTINHFKSNINIDATEKMILDFIEKELNEVKEDVKFQSKLRELKKAIHEEYNKTGTFTYFKYISI